MRQSTGFITLETLKSCSGISHKFFKIENKKGKNEIDFTNKKTLDFLINKLNGLREKSAELIELNKRNIEVTIYNIQECLSSGAVTVTKDNIHLYYEFMSDDDLEKNIDWSIRSNVFAERIIHITNIFGWRYDSGILKLQYWEDFDKYWIKNENCTKFYFFGVKDTLKPIDEYIKEIKESDSYKAYIANKS